MGDKKDKKLKKLHKKNSSENSETSAPVAGKVEKKDKKVKDKTPRQIKTPKIIERPILPETGTRFNAGSARQVAFDIVIKMAKDGKTAKEIRAELCKHREENGATCNIDSAYLNFVVASHPEFFKLGSNGKIEVIAEPKADPNAAKATKKKISNIKDNAKASKKLRKDKEAEESGKSDKKDKAEKSEKSDKKSKS